MNISDLPFGVPAWPVLAAGGAAATAVLLVLAWLLRRKGRGKLSSRVTAAATLLGLGWSAQGMWDTAVNHYHQDVVVASILFVVFEAMLAARMLKAHQYRTDRSRRSRHVASVWTIAIIMAVVVALGEGAEQAPARLAIPLLVAYGWYVDLTADDDPTIKPKASLRWTPRRLGLLIGMLEPEARDAQTIDRDRLRARIVRLAFRDHHGASWLNDVLRRPVRLQRLLTVADDADVAEVRSRLARSQVDLMVPAQAAPAPKAPRQDPPKLPQLPIGKQGIHSRDGRALRGPELQHDAVTLMLASVSPDHPRGMPTRELALRYDPPLKSRTAETFASEARRQIPRPINGFARTE
jgi:hypothetical protein